MIWNQHYIRSMRLNKLQEMIRADRERQAETHAYYLSLLPKYRKTSIVLPSKANQLAA